MSTDLDLRARLRLWRFRWLFGDRDTDLPEPGVVIEDLHLLLVPHCLESLHCLAIASVPATWCIVDISPLELSHWDHVDSFDETPVEVDEDLLDTAVVDVVEDTWNTQRDTSLLNS